MRSPIEILGEGLRVRVKVAPGARRNAIVGVAPDAGDGSHVKISVTAPPEGGKANEALIAMLAKEWHVAKSAVSVVTGATQRRKVVEIRGSSAELHQRLSAWLAGFSEQE